MDPVAYLSQGRFHRSIKCPRTGVRVSFALLGEWQDEDEGADAATDVILYVLPSGCSRYTGILLDGIAAAKGVRMVAIDRPGAGATPMCKLADRMSTATEQTLSVLEHLHVGHVSIFAHSAGWFYALNLLSSAPTHYFAPLRFVASSAFVPTHISGSALSYVSKSVVSLAPFALSALGSLIKALSWSSRLVPEGWRQTSDSNSDDPKRSADKRKQMEQQRQRNRAKKPNARFHPPHTPHVKYGLDAWRADAKRTGYVPRHPQTLQPIRHGDVLLFDCFVAEGCIHAVVEDFLFCLGKAEGMKNEALDKWTEQKLADAVAATKDDGQIVVLYAEKDGLISSKAQRYLTAMVKRHQRPGLKVDEWMMADGWHDTALTSTEVLNDVLDVLWPNAKRLSG